VIADDRQSSGEVAPFSFRVRIDDWSTHEPASAFTGIPAMRNTGIGDIHPDKDTVHVPQVRQNRTFYI
jgi:hypothetical protein